MKLPFDFSIKLIFRMLIPGLLLGLGAFPTLTTILEAGGWSKNVEIISGVLVVFLGWTIAVSDMWIYMLFEGRRFWPSGLRKHFVGREKLRLARIQKRVEAEKDARYWRKRDRLDRIERRIKNLPHSGPALLDKTKNRLGSYVEAETQKVDEAFVDLRNFPLNEKGEYFVSSPTELGNLMYAYESYPYRAYWMDSVFYWYRIWLKVDHDLREELDDKRAFVDSTIYTSFALYASGLLWLGYSVALTVQTLLERYQPAIKSYLPATRVNLFQNLPHVAISWLLAALFFLAGYSLYRLSIRLHAEYGELFKSMFDMYKDKIEMDDVVKEVLTATRATSPVRDLDQKEKLITAFWYLQYNYYYCLKCKTPLPYQKLASHACEAASGMA